MGVSVGHTAAVELKRRFFKPNIERKGRIARTFTAIALAFGGLFLLPEVKWAGLLLLAIGIFVAIEALRGWCFLRACGIKTKF